MSRRAAPKCIVNPYEENLVGFSQLQPAVLELLGDIWPWNIFWTSQWLNAACYKYLDNTSQSASMWTLS